MQSKNFYNTVAAMFMGSADASQSEGIEAIIAGCTQYYVTDKRMIAYILATTHWESDRSMQPIAERGKGKGYRYGSKIKQDHSVYLLPDEIYYGRGFCQTTWFENYQMLSNQKYAKSKGWDFLNNPDLLLTMEPAVWAMIHCMWLGLYTGVGLRNYFNSTITDYVNARKIINGLDQAQTIAKFAETYFAALSAG